MEDIVLGSTLMIGLSFFCQEPNPPIQKENVSYVLKEERGVRSSFDDDEYGGGFFFYLTTKIGKLSQYRLQVKLGSLTFIQKKTTGDESQIGKISQYRHSQ